MDTKKQINKLLDDVAGKIKSGYETDAYNYLIDYLEDLWMFSHEGERLFNMCVDILKQVKKEKRK